MQELDRKILTLLSNKEEDLWLTKISERLDYSRQYIWNRLNHLREEGLVEKKKGDGEQHLRTKSIYKLTEEGKNQ